jgi:hypothetical protein
MEGLLRGIFFAAKHLEVVLMIQQKPIPCLQVMEEHFPEVRYGTQFS